jgi:hypothetical protein
VSRNWITILASQDLMRHQRMASGKQLRFFDVPQCLAARVALAGFALSCLVTATTVQSSPLAGGR